MFSDINNKRLWSLYLFGILIWIAIIFINSDAVINFIKEYISMDGRLDSPRWTYIFTISILCLTLGLLIAKYRDYYQDFKASEPFTDRLELVLIALLLGFHAFALFFQNLRDFFTEDAILETMTALFALLSATSLLYTKKSLSSLKSRALITGVAILFLLFGLEEISWGQRLFGVETPQALAEMNHQKEINVHNLFNPAFIYIYPLFNLFVAVCFLYAHTIGKLFPAELRSFFQPKNSRFFALVFIWLFAHSLVAGFELTEEVIGVLMLFGAIRLLRQVRAPNTVASEKILSETAAPEDVFMGQHVIR